MYRQRRLMLLCCGIYSRAVLVVLSIPLPFPPSARTQPFLVLLVMYPLLRFSLLCVSLAASLPVCLPGRPDCLVCLARLLTCLHASLSARLLVRLLGLPAYLTACLAACLLVHLFASLSSCLLAGLLACLLAYLLIYLPACLLVYLPACFPAVCFVHPLRCKSW